MPLYKLLKSGLSLATFLILLPSAAIAQDRPATEQGDAPDWSFAIHGGAGTMARDRMTPEQQAEYKAALQTALDAGSEILRNGGNALDAVKAAIVLLEDDPKFNAGRGAVFTWEGANELDASIMDGRDRSAGAVTGVKSIKNPILLADKVRTDSPHVFLMGEGAEQFAGEQGLVTAGPDWFATEGRRNSLERMKARQVSALDVDLKFGTVGAVARDGRGNMAAGTSTGGMTGKRWGRIGDAPVIGAGTYADNRSCAVSATGWGEYFIRVGVAQEICTRLRYGISHDFQSASNLVEQMAGGKTGFTSNPIDTKDVSQTIADDVMAEVKELGGDGGVILVTPEGHALFSFNTQGMYRGRANSDGLNEVAIFGGEDSASETPDH